MTLNAPSPSCLPPQLSGLVRNTRSPLPDTLTPSLIRYPSSVLYSPSMPSPALPIPCRQLQQLEEQKKQLEHYNATIQEEKDTLLLQNNSLTERLEAVTNEKLPSHQFDGQTPIDKTLDLLQCLIMVSHLLMISCLQMNVAFLLPYCVTSAPAYASIAPCHQLYVPCNYAI